MPETQRAWIRRLIAEGWTQERGGKHQVKMTKPGMRPITLPENKRQAYSKGFESALRKQAGLSRPSRLDPMDTLRIDMPDRINLKIRMEDGAFWATVEEFPGVFATGDTLEELRASLEEGIALYVAEPGEDVRPVQLPPLEPADTVASAELAFA